MRKKIKMFAVVLSLCVSLGSLPVNAGNLGTEGGLIAEGENNEDSSLENQEAAPAENGGDSTEGNTEDDGGSNEEPIAGAGNNEGIPAEGDGNEEEPSPEGIGNGDDPTAEGIGNGQGTLTEGIGNGEDPSAEGIGNGQGTLTEGIIGNGEGIPTEGIGNGEDPSAEGIGNGQGIPAEPEFSYAQDFPELGVRVSIHAADYAIPTGASVQILAVEEQAGEGLDEIIQGKMDESMGRKRDEAGEERTVFDMYADLYAEAEKSYVFQIRISYTDGEGVEHVIYPEENDAIQVSFEVLDAGLLPEDEMHAAESYSLTEELPTPFSGNAVSSTYSFVIVRYAARADAQMVAAQRKAWEIINNYADREYFLSDPYRKEMTDAQYEELRQAATTATAGCATDYDKIKAIVGFVAERTYYDYHYLNNKESVSLYVNPYDVYRYKKTVCAGYARLVRTLLISIGIPCMDIIGDNHEFNAAYDSRQGKWIFADATWCSWNKYNVDSNGKEIWENKGYSYDRFDLTPDEIALLSNHEVYSMNGFSDGSYNSVYYSLVAPENNWKQMNWHMEICGVKNARADVITAENKLAGLAVTGVQDWAFANHNDITGSIVLPEGITKIGGCAFYNCTGLAGTLTLPSSLTSIGEWAFANCSSLRGNLALSAVSIGDYAFYNCSSLNGTLTLPAGLTSIGTRAFCNCSGLTGKLTLPNALTSIGDSAFSDCSGLTGDLTIPQGVTSVGEWAFSGCRGFNGKLTLPKGLKSIGYAAFYNCSGFTGTLTLPEALTTMNEWAFANCSGLTGGLTLPAGLTSIENYAFYGCGGLEGELRIPSNIKTIGEFAFACMKGSSLDKNLVFEGAVESIGNNAFYRSDCSNGQITIYAPEGSYAESYASANGYMYARKFAEYEGYTFYKKGNEDVTCRNSANSLVKNEFKCDGTYTYFLQADGTAMRDRLSYHPDGVHVIYFDQSGHEVFSDFANVKRAIAGNAVDDYCFFDVNGYLYVDVVTYDKSGTVLYYANPYGVMERGKWFQFSDTVMCADGTPWAGAAGGYGYANADGTLMKDTWTYDWEGRLCYMQGNGAALYP